MATIDEVITIRRTDGVCNAESRILVVPWMAGRIMSRSELSVGLGSGDAMCWIYVTSFNALSNAPSFVMSGTITNSSLDVHGRIKACFCKVAIWASLRTEIRTR
jgi:hypothetical protein